MLRRAATGVTIAAALWALADAPAAGPKIRGHRVGGSARVVHHASHARFHASYFYLHPHAYAPFYAYGPLWYGWWSAPYGIYDGSPPYAAAYLDTDVSPEEAEVHLDGEYVGIADDFDGFPGYLPIEPGRHTLSFRLEGYRSVVRTVKVPRGAVLDLRFSLPRGAEASAAEGEGGAAIVVPEPGPEELEDGEAGPPAGDDEERSPGFLRLRVSPEDASVYLDGTFYATARTLSGLHGDLRLEAGRHRLEVVKPGYRGATREIAIRPGESLSLTIDLKPEPRR